MKLIFILFFALLLNCGCSSENEINQNRYGIESAQYSEIITNFVDLNDDIVYLILDRLNLNALLSMVRVNSRYSDIADEVVRRKYRNYKIDIKTVFKTDGSRSIFNEGNNNVTIYDISFALDLLKYFGHYFRAINVHVYKENLELVDLTKIAQYLNKYCSKSLKQLQLEFIEHEILNEFTEPFEAVEELNIINEIYFQTEAKPLDELFPNLRRLIIYSRYDVNYNFINTELPRLEYFYINGDDQRELSVTNSENIRNLIRRNPTIRSLDLQLSKLPKLLTYINHFLPQLENLTLSDLHIDDERVQLKNVKKFELKVITNPHIVFSSIDKLSMPRLDSLNIGYPDNSNEWISFFNRHPQIRHLIL